MVLQKDFSIPAEDYAKVTLCPHISFFFVQDYQAD